MASKKRKPISAYGDCAEVYAQALDSLNGISVEFPERRLATIYRLRLHKYRVLLREQSCEIYPEGHPLHGSSPYEHIRCTLMDNPPRLILKQESFGKLEVKELEEDQDG